VIADWNAGTLDQAGSQLGSNALPLELDVRDRAAWERARSVTEEAFGPVEILVNNAGVAPDQNALVDMPPETFDRLLAIMATGVFNGIHTFGPGMRDRGRGHIVNTASMAGLVASARLGAYTAAKFATVGISEVLRAEMEAHGVGVSVLCPGLVRTNLGSDRAQSLPAGTPSPMAAGLDPSEVATQVVDAIRNNQFYVITHGEYGRAVAARASRLQQAFDSAPIRGSSENLPGTDSART
jgi:short-subunit dehydrogenase